MSGGKTVKEDWRMREEDDLKWMEKRFADMTSTEKARFVLVAAMVISGWAFLLYYVARSLFGF